MVFRAESGTGEFLGSVERTYKVGYESEVQFELNTDDYVFKGLEAVSQNDRSVSRADCVEFTELSKDVKKGIYKFKVKLISDTKDVLIRPVCAAIPKVVAIEPAFESNGCDQDTSIIITFNKAINPETFDVNYISIYAEDKLSEYFEEPKFSNDNKTLYIIPKQNKLILSPDEAKSVINIEVNYDFTNLKDMDGLTLSAQGTHTYKINKNFGNQKKVKVLVQADSVYGSFLSAGEKECVVGYTAELQFTLKKADYKFLKFEAVSSADNSISRADSIALENEDYSDETGIYKAKVRVLAEQNDILIRPVCVSIPKLEEILPKLESNGCDQDTAIKITFNKSVNPETFMKEYVSIYSDDDLTEYFDEAKFTSDNKTLYITPKTDKLILAPDGQKAMQSIKVDYNFGGMKDSDGLDISINGTYTYKINKNFGNQKKVKVLVRSDSAYGTFLSDGEKECVVGYTIDVQFTLNKEDYKFFDFEAVSTASDSASRADSISIENKDYNDEKGIYKAKIRVVKELNDILIRPKCFMYPAVVSHKPEISTEAQTTDKAIKIEFNKTALETQNTSLSSALFTYSNISIICQNDNSNMSNEYFEAPVFDEQKMLLTLTPKAKKLKTFIDNLHLGSVDLSVSLSSAISVIKDETILSLKQDDNSSFTVRYKADTEKTKPSATDFLVTRNKIQLDNVKNLTADKKFKLDSIDITAAEIPAADIQKNRASNGAVYIYGSYFDEDSGVKDVVISKRMLQDNGELSTAAETTFNPESNSQIAQFVSDGQGNTSFVIKYDFATLGKAYVIDVVVRDNCDNSSVAKTVSVFVPVYGEALGDNFYYLKNKPDYENEDLTIEQYSAELKNLKIYPTSFTAYSDVKIPVEDLTIYCEYKDKTGADKKQQFNLNEGENPYWNCPLNVDSLANLNTKITIYDGDFIYDQRDFKFPARISYNIDWISNCLEYEDPCYKVCMKAEPNHTVFGLMLSGEKVSGIDYPLSGYDQLDCYTRFTWYFETYNNQELYSDVVSFQEILQTNSSVIPPVEIESVSIDDSDWKTNGGYVNAIITLADDTWNDDKYDNVFFSRSPNDSGEYFNITESKVNKNVFTITEKIPVSLLSQRQVEISFTGKKSFKTSTATSQNIQQLSAVDYDVIPPKLNANHTEYDYYTFTLTDSGTGPKNADFTILGETFHIDSTDNYTVKVPATLIEEYRGQTTGDTYCSVKYSACDNAGNSINDATLNLSCGPHSWFSVESSAYYIKITTDRPTYADFYIEKTTDFYCFLEDCGGYWDLTPRWTISTMIKDKVTTPSGSTLGYKYFNYLTENDERLNDTFIRVQTEYASPQFVYTGPESSGDYDFLIPNGKSNNSVVICSDRPVYVHTLSTKCSYDKCKDWDSTVWEYYKEIHQPDVLRFTPDAHNPKVYKINTEYIDDDSCYCIIAHFANGDVLMTEVMQK